MSNSVMQVVEGIAAQIGQIFRTSLPSYCDIETADTDHALVTGKGTLVSGIRIDGVRFAVGPEEFEATVNSVSRALQSYLMNTAYTVDIFASCDADAVGKSLQGLSERIKNSCDRMEIDLGDVVDANTNALRKHAAQETIYVAIWTRESVMTNREAKDHQVTRREAVSKAPKTGGTGQNLFSTCAGMRERHEATVRSIYEDLRNSGIVCDLLTAHQMLLVARQQIDPGFTPDDWKPHLAGDQFTTGKGGTMLRNEDATSLDMSDIQYPRVEWQLFPRDAFRLNSKYVVIGDRAYAPVFIEIPPREVMPFGTLFDKLRAANVPWRTLFRIDGGGLKYMATRNSVASLLSFTSDFNKRIHESHKALSAVEFQGITNVRVKFAFCTWAPANDIDLLARRASRLAQTISSWGQAEVRDISGDPMLGFMSTVPFVSENHCGTFAVAPLAHIVRMLPIMRPASPWTEGSLMYRTMDGKIMPFEPGSSLQDTWNYIIFGSPGKGKSVQLATLILSSILRPGMSRLPRVGVVDIGPSSGYLVEMLKSSLPDHLKQQVGSWRMRMAPEYAINPFDTFAGCRRPTPEHKAFLVNLIAQIATPAEANEPYERMTELASKVIDDVYAQYHDKGTRSNPKRYNVGDDQKLDDLLGRLNFHHDRETNWWQVVDFLFDKGYKYESMLAQRFAVPNLQDCVAVSSGVHDMYGKIKVKSGESLVEAFSSLISSAIRDFPNLAARTEFDIGSVRIASLNLEEVASTGSRTGLKQTAVMYLLASYALTKDFRIKREVVDGMDTSPMYKEHHMKVVFETAEDFKWVVFDEFHKTANSPSVGAAVETDMREGRKYNIGVILSSQAAADFSPTMRELATGTFICDAGSEDNSLELQRFFGFNDTARRLLVDNVNGPKSSGAPLLAVLRTKEATFTQLLVSTLGIEALWALSTTSEDALVREKVCAVLGGKEGRRALAAIYPSQVKKEVERLRRSGEAQPIDFIAKNVLETWMKMKVAA